MITARSSTTSSEATSSQIKKRWCELPATVEEVLQASHAPSTAVVYKSYVTRFQAFLNQKGVNPAQSTETNIMEFLSKFANKKYTFSYVNAMKSAILSSVKAKNPSFTMNQELLKKFMKGVRRKCKLFTRKETVWDAEQVLNHLAEQVPAKTLAQLARETVTILALATGLRADDLWKLGHAVVTQGSSLFIPFLEQQKTGRRDGTSRAGVHVAPFPHNERICPVKLVSRYVELTKSFETRSPFLFIRSDNGQRITKPTLRKWLIAILEQAGISATPGSTRSAAASFAWSRCRSFDQIAAAAGWLRESTFQLHYRREILRRASNLMC